MNPESKKSESVYLCCITTGFWLPFRLFLVIAVGLFFVESRWAYSLVNLVRWKLANVRGFNLKMLTICLGLLKNILLKKTNVLRKFILFYFSLSWCFFIDSLRVWYYYCRLLSFAVWFYVSSFVSWNSYFLQ